MFAYVYNLAGAFACGLDLAFPAIREVLSSSVLQSHTPSHGTVLQFETRKRSRRKFLSLGRAGSDRGGNSRRQYMKIRRS